MKDRYNIKVTIKDVSVDECLELDNAVDTGDPLVVCRVLYRLMKTKPVDKRKNDDVEGKAINTDDIIDFHEKVKTIGDFENHVSN